MQLFSPVFAFVWVGAFGHPPRGRDLNFHFHFAWRIVHPLRTRRWKAGLCFDQVFCGCTEGVMAGFNVSDMPVHCQISPLAMFPSLFFCFLLSSLPFFSMTLSFCA
ncbi:hypothetical protein DFH06DRAFT_1200520 [Mycena polygramma]|nr:hypothetical protein DFH06DRAFT_1200520 [Mycena polygramma]